MGDLEALETVGPFGLFSHNIKDGVDELSAFCVVCDDPELE